MALSCLKYRTDKTNTAVETKMVGMVESKSHGSTTGVDDNLTSNTVGMKLSTASK